jgi:hypothetical protein
MSNTRRARPAARPPNDVEAAFADELRKGCPACGSRRVVGRYKGAVWAYTLVCPPDCPTHSDAAAAHKVASDAALRAGVTAGEKLSYRAVDDGAGVVGVVLGAG